ncbi:MAG TPA: SRPBCC domain-containing protein [Puia sp.]
MSTTRNSRLIKASPQILYEAFTSPKALETWLAPGDMTGKVHRFDLREGGSYEMSLFYPESEQGARGKTAGKEDRYIARFVELQPGKKIVEAIRFDSPEAHFQGEMIMEVLFEPVNEGTRVTMIFKNIPAGIRPEDNEKGTELSLQKLEKYAIGRAERA